MEEKQFQELVSRNQLEKILCANGYSTDCLLKAFHTPQYTIEYYKRWNATTMEYELEISYELFHPKRKIKTSKEIVYRLIDPLLQFIINKTVISSYTCLGNPYLNTSDLVPKDPEIIKLEADYQSNIIDRSYSGKYIKPLTPADPQAKLEVTQNRPLFKLAKELNIDILEQPIFDDLVEKLNSEIYNLRNIENRIQTELSKVDNRKYLLNEDDREMNSKCIEWLRTRQRMDSIVPMLKFRNSNPYQPFVITPQLT